MSVENVTFAAATLQPNAGLVQGVLQELCVVIGSSLSLVFIAFAFITFTLFSDLKDLAGFVMINLFSAIFLGQLFLLVGIDQTHSSALCHVLAVMLHYVWLAAMFWISIGIYDISQDVKTRLAPSLRDGNKVLRNHLLFYSMYGWGIPAVVVGLCLLIFYSNPSSDSMNKGGGFSYLDADRLHCWMVDQDGVVVGLAVPFLWLIAASSYWFYKTWQALRRTLLLSFKVGLQRQQRRRPEAILLSLYMKLIVIYLLTWLVGFTASVSGNEQVWLLFVGALSSVGSFVALLFTCNSSVFTVYASSKKGGRKKSLVSQISYGAQSEMSFDTTLSLLTLREVPDNSTV